MTKILIGIPAFNESKTIVPIISEAQKHGTVLVIDDGSIDDTFDKSLKTGATVLSHQKNYGYGKSISDIFQDAKKGNFDVLITIDSDGQHQPSEIPNFLEAIKSSDIVIGNRFLGKSNTPNYRKFGIEIINVLTSEVKDSQCGFRAFSKKAIDIIANNIYEKGMGASFEILKIAQNNNLKINEIPVTITYNKKQKHSQNPFSHGFDLLLAFVWWHIWEKPSKTLLPLSLIFFLGAAVSSIQTLNLYAQSHYIVQTWALLTGFLLILATMIFNVLILIVCFKNRKSQE